MMWDAPERSQMSDEARRTLQGWVQAGTSPQRVVVRWHQKGTGINQAATTSERYGPAVLRSCTLN